MVWQTIFCVLAACGLVLVIWVLFGGLLLPLRPRRGRIALLWQAAGDERALRRSYRALVWLRESGLGPRELILWDGGLTPEARQVAEALAQTDPRIRWAEGTQPIHTVQERTDGADDSAGHRQRGGVPE